MALIDKASLLMVPSTYEAGKLYNVLPSGNRAPDSTDQNSGYDQTRADFDFDRGSNASATRINSSGLIEKYRENLLLQSNQFDTTWSTANGASVTSGQSGYDGSSDAWTLETQSGQTSRIIQNTTGLGSVNSLSVYAKANTLDWIRLQISTATGNYVADFDLTNGVSGYTFGSPLPSIQSIGSGWYRVTISGFAPPTQVRIYAASGNNNLVGAGTILIQSAQLESGLVATDYLESTSVTGKAGVLIDLPRIDYSSGAGALLLEPSRQQLLQYSEYLSTFGGTATINDNAIISPEGLQNAAEVVLSASGTDSFYKEVSVTANTQYTLSFYVKQGSNTNNQLAVRDQTNSTFIATDVSYTASSTEWKRIEYTFTTPAGCVEARIYPHRSSLSSIGNGYFYGLQVEAGSYSTSYIPNHGTSGGVTRAADSCSVTGASDVIGQTEGTLFMDVNLSARDSFTYFVIAPNLATTSAYIGIGITVTAFSFEVLNSGIQVAYNYSNSSTGNFKIAFAYKANDFVAYVNGTQVMTDTSGSVPACSQIGLNNYDKDQPLLYKQAVLFNERLTNEELATLTTL